MTREEFVNNTGWKMTYEESLCVIVQFVIKRIVCTGMHLEECPA